MRIPDAYVPLSGDGGRAWVRREVLDWARPLVESGRALHAWAGDAAGARPLSGRGTVWNVPAPVPGPDGRARWAVRHYWRGGAVAPFLGDRYLRIGEPRPMQELTAAERVRARGIPTPAVIAGAVYPAGPLHYRADIVTEMIPDALDLGLLLFGEAALAEDASEEARAHAPEPADEELARAALEAAGRLVRDMERAGVYHPDLNARNILVTRDGEVRAHLLDLDRCQCREEGVPVPVGPMRDRLLRSLRKLARRAGQEMDGGRREALARGLHRKP